MTPRVQLTEEAVRAWRDIPRGEDQFSFEDWQFVVALADAYLAQQRVIRQAITDLEGKHVWYDGGDHSYFLPDMHKVQEDLRAAVSVGSPETRETE